MVMLTHSIDVHESFVSSSKIIELNFIKNDFIQNETHVQWSIFAKNIEPTSAIVTFKLKHVIISFKSNDTNFRTYYPQGDESTIFQWKVELLETIDTSASSYRLSAFKLEIKLVKEKKGLYWNRVYVSNNDIIRQKAVSIDEVPAQIINEIPLDEPKEEKNLLHEQKGPFYGYTGLINIGNTCYINATLQCLFNTTHLVKYFLNPAYQKELNHTNPLGLNGILATQFAQLLRQIWNGNQQQISPLKLRELICKKNTQFKGFAQQDAQEFLSSLLGLLHEDLNRIYKRPVLEPLESDGWCDEKIASESWKRFLSRDDSIIVDNFFGQFKSKLTCPECNKVSIIFEPFNSLLVPLPFTKKQLECVVVLKSCDVFKFHANVISNGSFSDVIDQLRHEFRDNYVWQSFQILLISNGLVKDIFSPDSSFELLNNLDLDDHTIVVNEVRSSDEVVINLIIHEIKCKPNQVLKHKRTCDYCAQEAKPDQKLSRCSKCHNVTYCDVECQAKDWQKHKLQCVANEFNLIGMPFIFSFTQSELNEEYLAKCFIKYLKHFIRLKHTINDKLMQNEQILDNYFSKLFEFETREKKLSSVKELCDYILLKLESKSEAIQCCVLLKTIANIQIIDLKSNQLKSIYTDANNILNYSLDDCLKLFTQPEKLNEQNPWYCPKCKKHQEAIKQINLWKLPTYLIIILKRFQAKKEDSSGYPEWMQSRFSYYFDNRVSYQKLNTFIEFPLSNLNMSKYVIDPHAHDDENTYDLYGVINHLGDTPNGGHYTSFSRFYDKNDLLTSLLDWRLFDDSRVYDVRSDQVVTQDAYVLFYRKRKSSTSELSKHEQLPSDSDGSSSSSSSSSSTSQLLNGSSSSTESEYFEAENEVTSVFTDLNDID